MNANEQSAATTGPVNPYPPSAVAELAPFGSEQFTIVTPPVRTAVNALNEYLDRSAQIVPGDPTPPGHVLAIVGNFGSGKTHLAVYLQRLAMERTGGAAQTLYLTAPPDTFVALYRAFIHELHQRRDIVDSRLRQYYADIVAESLRSSEVTTGLADKLAEGEVDPVQVVRELGLPESMFLARLQQQLRGITDDVAFSRALTLLLRGGFDKAVWDWLSGDPPAEVLRERGITTTLVETEKKALEAMAVFALVIGHGTNRFLVIIDELDQLITAAGRPAAALEAFKQLLRVFGKSGTFLVLAGLPDLVDTLRLDILDRIDTSVRMERMTAAHAREYVLNRQGGTLAPFTEEIIDYIVYTGDGLPRNILKLLYRLWSWTVPAGQPVTAEMVRAAARDMYEVADGPRAREDVVNVLRGQFREYVPDHPVGGDPDARVDFWVLMPGTEIRCGIVLTETPFAEEEVEALVRQARAVQKQGQCELILVVLGRRLTGGHVQRLTEAYGREPLLYDRYSFADRFAHELKYVASMLMTAPDDSVPIGLRQQLERLSWQQVRHQHRFTQRTQDIVEQMNSQFRAVLARLDTLSYTQAPVAGEPGTPGEREPAVASGQLPAALPDPVGELFRRALESVDLETRVGAVFRAAFDPSEADSDVRRILRARLPVADVQRGTGVATLLSLMLRAFGEAIGGWYLTAGQDEPLSPVNRQGVETLGQLFDAAYGNLPVFPLQSVEDLIGRARDAGVPCPPVPRQTQVHQLLGGFGSKVTRAVLASFSEADG